MLVSYIVKREAKRLLVTTTCIATLLIKLAHNNAKAVRRLHNAREDNTNRNVYAVTSIGLEIENVYTCVCNKVDGFST